MIGRDGKPVIVGWQPHELLWLEAANSLPERERFQALVDISNMTTRSFMAVRYKAGLIRRQKAEEARAALQGAGFKKVMVPAGGFAWGYVRAPTMARLMAGK